MTRLGDILLRRGATTAAAIERALARQELEGGRLGTCLLEIGEVTEPDLLSALEEQHRAPSCDFKVLESVKPTTAAALPPRTALRCLAIPLRVSDRLLEIAMASPLNLVLRDELSFAAGKRIEVSVATEVSILATLERLYGFEPSPRVLAIADRLVRARGLWMRELDEGLPAPSDELDDPYINQPGLDVAFEPPDLPELEAEAFQDETPSSLPSQEERGEPESSGPGVSLPGDLADPPRNRETSLGPELPPKASGFDLDVEQLNVDASPNRDIDESLRGEAAAEGANQADRGLDDTQPLDLESLAVNRSQALHPPARAESTGAGGTFADRAEDLAEAEEVEEIAPPQVFDDLGSALDRAESAEEVGRALLGAFAADFDRVLLLKLQKGAAQTWRARLPRGEAQDLADLRFSLAEPSLLRDLREGRSFYLGPLAPIPLHRRLSQASGFEVGRECLALPIRVREHLAAVVLVGREEQGLGRLDLDRLRRYAERAGESLERCILRRKKG